MTRSKLILVLLAALLTVALAGCGGADDEVPADAIAVVGGDEIDKSEFDALMGQAERSYKAQKREWPKAGTPEYNQLKSQAVQFLVQRVQYEQEAEDLDVEIDDEELDKRLEQLVKQYFGGDRKKYDAELKKQGIAEDQVRRDVEAQLLQEKIFAKVTEDVEVSDEDIEKYYNDNKQQYGQPESRDVRHILIQCANTAQCKKAKTEADSLFKRIKGGEDFAKLAKQHSDDTTSKVQGGKLTVSRGQTVAPFDQTAFNLGKGTLSQPIKTQYGWHLVEPLSEIKPAKTTPLKDVKASIKQQLLQTKKNEAMAKWVEDTRKEFCDGKLHFQVGFAPKPDPCAKAPGTGTGTTSTTNS